MSVAVLFLSVLLALVVMVSALVIVRLRRRLGQRMREQHAVHQAAVDRLAGLLEGMSRAQNEIRFQARLLNAVGQAVLAVDMDARVVYCNRAAVTLLGVSVHDAVGSRLEDVIRPIEPPPSAGVLDHVREGNEWTGEATIRRPDGSTLTIVMMDSPIHDESGSLVGMVRVAGDITARKHSEVAARVLADASATLTASLDYADTVHGLARLTIPALADACVVDVVDEDGRMWRLEAANVAPEMEEVARDIRRRYPLDLENAHPISDVIRSGEPKLISEVTPELLRGIARDEKHHALLERLGYRSAMIVPLISAGTPIGAISFFMAGSGRRYQPQDMSVAEELARRAAIALEHARLYETALLANQAKSDFLAVMSHELRTPLTTVMGYTDLLLSGLPEPMAPKATVYVERVRAAAWHLLGLIEQILIYARLEMGREQLHPERLVVGDLLADVAALIEPVAAERGLHFKVQPSEAPTTIETDLTKVRQILLNLLSNAVKFTESGDVILEAEAEDGEIRFFVRDTGVGIAPEHHEKVFDPFWQVDQSSTRHVGGTGLGLSVSRRLARMLGGDISLNSSPGTGTVFTLRLPARWSVPLPRVPSERANH